MLFLLAAVVSVLAVVLCSVTLLQQRRQRRQQRQAAGAGTASAQHVLVVGGSFAGLSCCSRLLSADCSAAHSLRVTLLEPRDYFEYTPGILRALLQPEHYRSLVTPMTDLGVAADSRFTHRRAVVTDIDLQQRRLRLAGRARVAPDAAGGAEDEQAEEEEWLHYDFVVIATGSSYAQDIKPRGPLVSAAGVGDGGLSCQSLQQRKRELAAMHSRIRDSRHVIIVGGGYELAAEVCAVFDCHEAKRCSLLCKGSSLLPSLPPAAGRYAARWLSARGVSIVFRSSRSAAEIDSSRAEDELLLDCTGLMPIATPAIRAEQQQQQRAGGGDSGRLTVTAALQSPAAAACGRLFCIGDCAELDADAAAGAGAALTRLAYTAEQQAGVAADNIFRCLSAGEAGQPPLLSFPSALCGSGVAPPRIVCCSLGSRDGLLCFNDLLLPGPLAAIAKWAIEWSKVRQYRGWHSAQRLWDIAEHVVYALNRAYRSIEKRRAAGSREVRRQQR